MGGDGGKTHFKGGCSILTETSRILANFVPKKRRKKKGENKIEEGMLKQENGEYI